MDLKVALIFSISFTGVTTRESWTSTISPTWNVCGGVFLNLYLCQIKCRVCVSWLYLLLFPLLIRVANIVLDLIVFPMDEFPTPYGLTHVPLQIDGALQSYWLHIWCIPSGGQIPDKSNFLKQEEKMRKIPVWYVEMHVTSGLIKRHNDVWQKLSLLEGVIEQLINILDCLYCWFKGWGAQTSECNALAQVMIMLPVWVHCQPH